jgi:phosphoribosyl-ATP pyrophosphohydrolase
MQAEYDLNVRTLDDSWIMRNGGRDGTARKLVEEAAEVFGAHSALAEIRASFVVIGDEAVIEDGAFGAYVNLRADLVSEIADVIQAACDLALVYGVEPDELAQAMSACYERNRERGRCDG